MCLYKCVTAVVTDCFVCVCVLNAGIAKKRKKKNSLVLLKESDKMCACCKLLNAWALKHHLPDLEMNSTVITSSSHVCTFGLAHNYTAICSFPLLAHHGNTYRILYLYIQHTTSEFLLSVFVELNELYVYIACEGFVSYTP